MALHFDVQEFEARQQTVCADLERLGLDGLLLFRQESMYYLTGYDTGGYVTFQGMYMTGDRRFALLTRAPDRLQASLTSILNDVRIWKDHPNANPALDLRDMVADLGGAGKRIGVEYHAYGLTGALCKTVDAAFEDFAELTDASDLVTRRRLVKSAAELEYVRRAGALTDEAQAVALRDCCAGANLGEVYGEMQKVIMAGGGDPPASPWPLGCGEEALLVRYHTGLGFVSDNDQVTFEITAAFRHYHAPSMFVVLTGKPQPGHTDMYAACRDALEHCEQTLKVGNTVGEVFDVHARVLTKHGFGHAHLNACGYTMNANYAPNWMDHPMIMTGSDIVLELGMVFFMHMILLNGTTGLSMSLGETCVVTESGAEPVSHAPREMVVIS